MPYTGFVAQPEQIPGTGNRLAYFRSLREQLAPARAPADAFENGLYVERKEAVSARIAAELEVGPSSTHVLVGGVGSGKTTELLSVQQRLSHHEDIHALYVDVTAGHDLDKMKPGAVAIQVALKLAGLVPEQLMDHMAKQALERLRHLAYGYSVLDQDYDDQDDGTVQVPGILQATGLTFPVSSAAFWAQELLKPISQTNLVALIDGLDRLNSMTTFEEVVREDVRGLTALGVGVVLVAPLRAQYRVDRTVLDDTFERFHYQPWIDVDRDEAGSKKLTELLDRRAPHAFDAQARASLRLGCGGVARDLLALAQTACVQAYMDGADVVTREHARVAVDAFGRKHMQGLRSDELEVLRRVGAGGAFNPTSEDEFALLMTLRILEYRTGNEAPYYRLHPTIVPFIT